MSFAPILSVASKSTSAESPMVNKVAEEDLFEAFNNDQANVDTNVDTKMDTSMDDNGKTEAKRATRRSKGGKSPPPKKGPKRGPKTKSKQPAKPRGTSGEAYRGPPTEEIDGGWPPGWIKTEVPRKTTGPSRSRDKYWFSPGGKKFRSMIEVKKFIAALSQVKGDENEAWKIFKSIKL